MTDNVPATLESVIAARIGPIIGEMIPEEALRQQIKRQVDAFMAKSLQDMLSKELTARFTVILKDELDGPGYRELWDGGRHQAGAKVQEMIRDLVPEIVVAAMNAPFNAVMQDIKYKLQSLGRG